MNDLGICALVSGAASEIGMETVRILAGQGASVLAVDSNEEKVQAAIESLDLQKPEDVLVSELEGGDFFSWYDLGNLIGAYFNTLNVFVHIGASSLGESARTLNVEALRQAEAASSDSFITAVGFLDKFFVAAAEENPEGACVIAVTPSPTDGAGSSVSDSLTHAMSSALAEELTREYSTAEKNVRVRAFRPSNHDARAAAAAVVGLTVDAPRS